MTIQRGFPRSEPVRIDALTVALGLSPEDVEPYGWQKGKLALGLDRQLTDRPSGKLVNVTAINPTPLGEGKTVTAIGLSMGLNRIGHSSIVTLREPSQGPLFGIKGGGAGGGEAHLVPADEINLHFTGDIHAITAATNLLAALIDNHVARGQTPIIDPQAILWRRCLDVCDRSLRHVRTGVGDTEKWREFSTGFDLSAASELMAILALARSLSDLKERISRIVVAFTSQGDPVTVDDLQATGALLAMLKDALRPNLVQTCEGTPALVHAGPFANIAHGNSSVLADLAAVRLAEFVVTESGFGSDCGAEKFMHIKCRASGLVPAVEVLVCTARAIKLQSGRFAVRPGKPLPPELLARDLDAVRAGSVNLEAHLDILRKFGVPTVVAINRFPDDHEDELELIRQIAIDRGADGVADSTAFAEGSSGATDLAAAVVAAGQKPSRYRTLYENSLSPAEKLECVATEVYGADGLDISPAAQSQLDRFRRLGFDGLPVCIAKTQYSLSHDPKLLGRPVGFRLPIREVRLAAGAGFLYALAGDINTMPALPARPAASAINVDDHGHIQNMR
ncbi:MAG: formate--tetrahydrofolate ligase [Planctomycetaceae bacterium]